MLRYSIHEGNFRVTEVLNTFIRTTFKTVDYSPDLKKHRVNKEPWRDCTQGDIDWFEKVHRKHYKRTENGWQTVYDNP